MKAKTSAEGQNLECKQVFEMFAVCGNSQKLVTITAAHKLQNLCRLSNYSIAGRLLITLKLKGRLHARLKVQKALRQRL